MSITDFFREFWDEMLAVLGGTTAFLFIAAYLIRTTVSHYLDKAKDGFRAELEKEKEKHKSELDKEQNKHRAELDRIAFTHQTKFSRLHAEQAKIIARLFSLLCDVRDRIFELGKANDGVAAEPLFASFREDLDRAAKYFVRQRIYFSKTLGEQLFLLFESYRNLGIKYYRTHYELQQGDRYVKF